MPDFDDTRFHYKEFIAWANDPMSTNLLSRQRFKNIMIGEVLNFKVANFLREHRSCQLLALWCESVSFSGHKKKEREDIQRAPPKTNLSVCTPSPGQKEDFNPVLGFHSY